MFIFIYTTGFLKLKCISFFATFRRLTTLFCNFCSVYAREESSLFCAKSNCGFESGV